MLLDKSGADTLGRVQSALQLFHPALVIDTCTGDISKQGLHLYMSLVTSISPGSSLILSDQLNNSRPSQSDAADSQQDCGVLKVVCSVI
jgi:hypothetical protein